MADVSRDDVLRVLSGLGPKVGIDPVASGLVEGIALRPGAEGTTLSVALAVPQERAAALEPLRKAAEEALSALPGVARASVVLTAAAAGGASGPAEAPARGQGSLKPPGVRHVIAVASGKGGVGKSTTAANLALALAAQGLRVALFDADIYGPSVPRMLGVAGVRPQARGERLLPITAHGLAVMSIGFLVPEDDPVIWRGPMVMGALEQLLRDVEWGERDVMVVDMPPGTGDTQLTMSQRVTLSGAVIVSTPQDIALLDARKGLAMFRKVRVPILGVIENMSHYVCPACGHRDEVFGHGGAQRTAAELDAPFLGDIPLDIRIRETMDAGTPVVVSDPDGPHAAAYAAIATRLWQGLEAPEAAPATPRIVIE